MREERMKNFVSAPRTEVNIKHTSAAVRPRILEANVCIGKPDYTSLRGVA